MTETVDARPWCWNVENSEHYERAESREDAIREAVEDYAGFYFGEDPKEFSRSAQANVQIGRLHLYRFGYSNGEWLMEQMRQDAADNCGDESTEDWPDAKQSDIDDLGRAVDAVIQEWIVRTGNTPTFGTVHDLESPTLEEVEAVIAKYGITLPDEQKEV